MWLPQLADCSSTCIYHYPSYPNRRNRLWNRRCSNSHGCISEQDLRRKLPDEDLTRVERYLQRDATAFCPHHRSWPFRCTVYSHRPSTSASIRCMSYYCLPHLCILVRQDILAETGQASKPIFQSLYINSHRFLQRLHRTPPCASIDFYQTRQDMSGSLVPRNHRYKYHISRQSPNHRIHKDLQTKQ